MLRVRGHRLEAMTNLDLFIDGDITLHSGGHSDWKIECDSLSRSEIALFARLIAERVGPFGLVEGVPRGGERLAVALMPYADPTNPSAPLMIVDDVCTTGKSLEDRRAGRDAIGYVIFARRAQSLPSWARAIFVSGDYV